MIVARKIPCPGKSPNPEEPGHLSLYYKLNMAYKSQSLRCECPNSWLGAKVNLHFPLHHPIVWLQTEHLFVIKVTSSKLHGFKSWMRQLFSLFDEESKLWEFEWAAWDFSECQGRPRRRASCISSPSITHFLTEVCPAWVTNSLGKLFDQEISFNKET